jgi:hypothetical protein
MPALRALHKMQKVALAYAGSVHSKYCGECQVNENVPLVARILLGECQTYSGLSTLRSLRVA